MKRIITAHVNNTAGVLNRITGLFSRRNYNIESITVGVTENPSISRMTFVVNADSMKSIEQVIKQLHKQIDVLKVKDITDESIVARELALIKVAVTAQQRAEVMAVIDPFRGSVIDIGHESMTIQITGDQQKVDTFIDLLRPYGIKELARTGITAFNRSSTRSVSDPYRLTLIN